MMQDSHYVIFELNQVTYALPAIAVEEVVLLPAVQAIAAAIPSLMGVVNVRGRLVPVIQLVHCLGLPVLPCQPSDSIILVQSQGQRVGLLVQQLCTVQWIAPQQLHADAQPALHGAAQTLITGMATLATGLVCLLDPVALVQVVHAASPLSPAPPTGQPPVDPLAHLSAAERELLHQRSQLLQQPLSSVEAVDTLSVVIVSLNQEYLAIESALIQEFVNVRKLTLIPCCPPHILGNMNLRGEILTLIDIGWLLNISTATPDHDQKALVLQGQGTLIGIVVHEIIDVIPINSHQILAQPSANQILNHEYFQGVIRYQSQVASFLNLNQVMASEQLIVDMDV